jgi:outer membrane lipoprotein-sorting protein
MTVLRKIAFCTVLVLTAALETACSGRMVLADDDLGKVLAKLDASAKTFSSAQADIVWDNVQTQPVLDKDSQVGTVVFARAKNGQMQVAVHIKTDNGKPVLKDLSYADGIGKMYEAAIKQLQVFKVGDKSGQLESFLTLGFGGSGTDLEANWKVSLLGTEPMNGVSVVKLDLVPLQKKVLDMFPHVTIWIDPVQGISYKQIFYEPGGDKRTATYKNIRYNQPLANDVFTIKPAPGTNRVVK